MKYSSIAMACVCTVLQAAHAQTTRLNLAVNNLQGKGIEASEAEVISDRLRSELVRTGVYRVMERGEMESILKEQGFQQSGVCDDAACLIEVGQMLGVQRMLAGTIGKVGSTYTISARMIDVGTGEIVSVANFDIRGSIDQVLTQATVEVAKKFAGDVPAGKPVETVSPSPAPAQTKASPAVSSLRVETKPAGATVLLNGKESGKTPYAGTDLEPGKYALKVELAGYTPVVKTVTLAPDKPVELSLVLKGGEAKADRRRRPGKIAREIMLGTIAGAALAGGIVLNSQAEQSVKSLKKIENDYRDQYETNWNAGDPTDPYDDYASDYEREHTKATIFSNIRTGCYIGSGVLGALFVVGFAF